jgi:signal transduction histidine kinase/CheY-like chemotaxis protein
MGASMSPPTIDRLRIAFLVVIMVLIGLGFTLHINLEKLAALALFILAAWHVSRTLVGLRGANRDKEEFLVNVSHELRTPLYGILTMIDLLLQDETVPGRRQRLRVVKDCADMLLALVNDLLDQKGLETGKLELVSRPFDLSVEVADVCETLAGEARKKGLELACQVAPDVPRSVVGDPDRLRQLLMILVANAIKFTERGQVELTARVVPETCVGITPGIGPQATNPTVEFAVTDTGVGISPDNLRRIFGPFEQGDASATRKHGGTGLGLSIVARLVELMGGRHEVESKVGCGSTFRVFLRFFRAPDQVASRPSWAARRLNVLVVEDNLINQQVARDVLVRAGQRVRVANNGVEALAACANEPFDLVLMDVQMPEMDGLHATAVIRAREKENGRHTFIAALTARTGKHTAEECLGAGMDVYLTKPLRPERLYQLLAEVPGGADTSKGQRPPIDDEAALVRNVGTILNQLVRLLEREGPAQLEELAAGVAARDARRVSKVAHKLVGSLGTFRASAAVALARRLDEMGRRGGLGDAAAPLAELRTEVERLLVALRELVTRELTPPGSPSRS